MQVTDPYQPPSQQSKVHIELLLGAHHCIRCSGANSIKGMTPSPSGKNLQLKNFLGKKYGTCLVLKNYILIGLIIYKQDPNFVGFSRKAKESNLSYFSQDRFQCRNEI